VVVGVVAVVPVFSTFAVFVSALAAFAVLFASALTDLVEREASVFVVALAVVVFGAFAPAFVVFGDETFVVFGDETFVVFGDETFVVCGDETFVVFGDEALVDDTCCGLGVDPFLPCAATVTDEASTKAADVKSAIIVRVMSPPRGHSPDHVLKSKRHSSGIMNLSLLDSAVGEI
jgi:hypothetical protein